MSAVPLPNNWSYDRTLRLLLADMRFVFPSLCIANTRAPRYSRLLAFRADQRGAVAFEMIMVYAVLLMGLLLPLSDVASFGFQYISAWEALRAFGQYLQYNPPADVTNTTGWPSTTTAAGYTSATSRFFAATQAQAPPAPPPTLRLRLPSTIHTRRLSP
jgi:hypothetical protein